MNNQVRQGSKYEMLERVRIWSRTLLETQGATAHGWFHVSRVCRLAVLIAKEEGVDPDLATLAALIHDVGRAVPGPGSEHGRRSAEMAEPVLIELGLAQAEREAVLHAVRWHNSTRADTLLLCVLRDADMLDGMGAIGLLRALMSKHMLPPYHPEVLFDGVARWPPEYVADQVRGQMAWVGQMNTVTGRRLAQDRFAFMKAFASQVRKEVELA